MNLFVRKEDFLTIHGFEESLITCEDVDFSYRLGKRGKLLADMRIRMIHLGEAATICQFWRKEFWRGLGNFQGVRSHGLSLRELPTLLLPLYFAVVVPMLMAFLFTGVAPLWLMVSLLALLLPSVMVLYKNRGKNIQPEVALKLLVLLQVYFLARTIAAAKSLFMAGNAVGHRS